MSVIRHIQFCGDLVRALANEMRFRYYRAAYRHCGETHPDAWLIARRMTHAQLAVTDFLRKYTNN